MSPALALKAELVLALQLATRHRAPRLAILLVLSLTGMLLGEQGDNALLVRQYSTVLMAGILAAVAASRVTSRGAVLASARHIASPWWIAPVGRLGGAIVFALLPVAIAAGILIAAPMGTGMALPLLAIVPLYIGAVGGMVMALTPLTGASVAAAMGLLASMVGGFPPLQVAAFLHSWPVARQPIVFLWSVLPFSWRVSHWLVSRQLEDPVVLAIWLAGGLCAACWVVNCFPVSPARRSDA